MKFQNKITGEDSMIVWFSLFILHVRKQRPEEEKKLIQDPELENSRYI